MKKVLALASIVVLITLTAAAQKKPRVAQSFIAAWNSHDVEKVIPLFTNDVLYEDVTFGAVNHGSAELRKFAASVFAAVPDVRFELVKSAVDGQHGTIEWVFTGTDRGLYKTGKRFSVRGVSVIELRGGRISRNLDFYDAASIMRPIGLLPSEKTDLTKYGWALEPRGSNCPSQV